METIVNFIQTLVGLASSLALWAVANWMLIVTIVVGIALYVFTILAVSWALQGFGIDIQRRPAKGLFYTYAIGLVVADWLWDKFHRWRFEKVFGFDPKTKAIQGDDSAEWRAKQKSIDDLLKKRADAMYDAFEAERTARLERVNSRKTKLCYYESQSRQAKRRFWYAHGLAKRFYYDTRAKFGDYLTYPRQVAA